MNINYQQRLDSEIEKIVDAGTTPTLLLHACCAPCSSYCLEYLSKYFRITILYYNPNIYPDTEYWRRLNELRNFLQNFPWKNVEKKVKGVINVINYVWKSVLK